jgi:hypothetical protein
VNEQHVARDLVVGDIVMSTNFNPPYDPNRGYVEFIWKIDKLFEKSFRGVLVIAIWRRHISGMPSPSVMIPAYETRRTFKNRSSVLLVHSERENAEEEVPMAPTNSIMRMIEVWSNTTKRVIRMTAMPRDRGRSIIEEFLPSM